MSSAKRRRPQPQDTRSAKPQAASPEAARPATPPANERLGDILRRVRERRGESIEAIAETLRIHPRFIDALEGSRYDELPADAYAIGFLRTYANYLDLDGKGAIDQYRREMAGRRRKPELSMPQPISEGRAPTVALLIVATIVALLVYGVWYGMATSDRAAVATPPELPQTAGTPSVPEAETPSPAPAPSSVPAPQASVPTAPPAPAPTTATPPQAPAPAAAAATAATPASRIVLRVVKPSWVLIADSTGRTMFDRTLKAGEAYAVPDIKGLTLTTGNAGGIVLSVDGVNLPPLGDDSRVARNIPLDPAQLKAQAASTSTQPAPGISIGTE